MHQLKRWTTLALLVFSLVLVTACGTSLQKPTGLEDDAPIESVVEQDSDVITDENEDGDEEELEADEEISESAEESDVDKAINTAEKAEDSEAENKVEEKKNSTVSKSTTASNKQADKKSSGTNKKTNKSTSNASPKKNSKPKSNSQSSSKKTNDSKEKENNKSPTKPKSESKPKTDPKPTPPKKDTATISIVISSSEVPLSATQVEINDGDKVVDVLNKVTADKGIQRDVTNGNNYVKGLANVYEFDRGQGSGWMYRINGVFPDRGVGAVPVQNGDRIEFLYTTDLGKDLGANLQPYRR